MRAALLLVFAACSPEIASGSYLCGAERDCPPDEACDGVTDTCVIATSEKPFACAAGTQLDNDDTKATALPLPMLACVSPVFRAGGCFPAGDAADWFSFSTPSACTSVEVSVRIVYPVAYEGIGMELWDLGGNVQLGTDVPCADAIGDPANVERCIKVTLAPGGSYALGITPNGQGTCGGACAYNRYQLAVQLETP